MRERTDEEREVFGVIETIYRNMRIDKENPGYPPLLDATVFAYASPEKKLKEIIDTLSRENHYLGLFKLEGSDKVKTNSERVCLAIVHAVKTGIESASEEYLRALGLDGMKIILEGKRGAELEEVLLAEIGDGYAEYSNDEKIAFFFIKKVLKEAKKY